MQNIILCLILFFCKKYYTIVNTEKKENILSDQFCKLEKFPICKNNKFGLVANKCPVIGLRKLKSYNIQKDSNVTFGDLNLLGWVVLKSDKTNIEELNDPLAKLCAIQNKGY